MTNQPTNNEWIEKARKQFGATKKEVMAVNHKFIELLTKDEFSKAILSNLPKPTEVVAPVDIEDIIEKIGYVKRYSDTRYFDWEEVKKELKKLIIDNLQQSISREAVEKLREKYIKVNNDKDNDFYGALDELLSELDDLLESKDKDGE